MKPRRKSTITAGARNARYLRHLTRPGPWLRRFVFWGGAIATGATAVAFARASDQAFKGFEWAIQQHPAVQWLLPPVGLGLVAWLTRNVFPGTQGSGIPQTMAALSVE